MKSLSGLLLDNSLKDFDNECLVFAELLLESQAFIREVEEPYSVSLRDVKRAITLVKFFAGSLQNRPQLYSMSKTFNRKKINVDEK
ncbi:14160_t:CDS:2, partial [Ambispora leptoticha]